MLVSFIEIKKFKNRNMVRKENDKLILGRLKFEMTVDLSGIDI